jgi:hypothetical protein
MRTMIKKTWRDDIANKKPKEQLLSKAFQYFTTGSGLKHNDFNQKMLKHTLSIPLSTFAIKQVTNNHEFVETKKELTLWERVSPNETCMRVREGRVWAFCGARSMVEGCYDLSRTF